jgi:hypothetical protein
MYQKQKFVTTLGWSIMGHKWNNEILEKKTNNKIE